MQKSRNRFRIEKFAVLAQYFEQHTDGRRYRRKISKSEREVLRGGISRIYLPFLSNWKPCHGAINSRS